MLLIKPEPQKILQTMQGFGASGAWWAQLTGSWEEPVRKEIAALLYSKTDGIGMSVYRHNLGGGSKENPAENYPTPSRMASSYETAAGGYDFTRDAAATQTLRDCVEAGATEVVLFVNSPPESMTRNHKAYCEKAWRANLIKGKEAAFARYVCDLATHFLAQGLPVKYISPVNEPLWIWTQKSGQEGCHYHPAGIRRVFRAFARELESRPLLANVRLAGPENGDIRFLNWLYIRAAVGPQKIRKHFVTLDTHSYCVPQPKALMPLAKRLYALEAKLFLPNLPRKTTEWTHMCGGRDYGMDSALEQARVMFEDFRLLNVCGWQHWIACSEVDFCDGLLYLDLKKQSCARTKRYAAFGNFSKFVPPGANRIRVRCDGAGAEVLGFTHAGKTILVLRNPGPQTQASVAATAVAATLYVTDETRDLEPVAMDAARFSVPAHSVCTLVY
jgi:O-glycosyl hydrolase